MSRRRPRMFVVVIITCRVCGHELGQFGRDTHRSGLQSWLHDAPRATVDDQPTGQRIVWNSCECGRRPNPVIRTDRLNANLDTLITKHGPRAQGVIAL